MNMKKKNMAFGFTFIICLALALLLSYGMLSAMSVGDENAANDASPDDKARLS